MMIYIIHYITNTLQIHYKYITGESIYTENKKYWEILLMIYFIYSIIRQICIHLSRLIIDSLFPINDLRTQNINIDKYLGTWYQVARLPNSFQNNDEKNVTAIYNKTNDYNIEVLNKQYSGRKLNMIMGNASLVDEGKLMVSLFTPFYAPYWVLMVGDVIDGKYQYAVVSDPSKTNLWILSRKKMSNSKLDNIIKKLDNEFGFKNLDTLIYTDQDYKSEQCIFDKNILNLIDLYEKSSLLRFDNKRFNVIDKNIKFKNQIFSACSRTFYREFFNSLKYFFLNIHNHIHIVDRKKCSDKTYEYIIESSIYYLTIYGFTFRTRSTIEIHTHDGLIMNHSESWSFISFMWGDKELIRIPVNIKLF
jgi:apolipoprotein D and lipocalin family protein